MESNTRLLRSSMPNDIEKYVKTIRVRLWQANNAYYEGKESIMPDTEFDSRLAELKRLEEQHPELDDPKSPTHRVGH